jgi:phosphoribosylanthranilate isomerase
MAQVRIKICGITNSDDALAALEAGADFVGLNLFSGPRKITVPRAAEILSAIGHASPAVLLLDLSTLDGSAAANQLADGHGVKIFQLYGDLSSARLLPRDDAHYWPVFRIAERNDLKTLAQQVRRLAVPKTAMVLDAYCAQGHGGTGKQIDLLTLAAARDAGELRDLPPMILAGGLNPDNVGQAIKQVQPWAVDVSSGVEVAGRAGIKDHGKLRAFIQAARL